METIIYVNSRTAKVGLALHISDQIANSSFHYKDGHYLLIQGTLFIDKEALTLINIYISHEGLEKFIKFLLTDLKKTLTET